MVSAWSQVDTVVYAALVRAGNNLNQLAQWANTERRYLAEADATAAYREIRAAVAQLRAALRPRPYSSQTAAPPATCWRPITVRS
jgi:hypothetical protein